MNLETTTTVTTGPPAGSTVFRTPRFIEMALRQACLIEVRARKAGNVHPEKAFADLNYDDYLRSTEAIVPTLSRSQDLGPAVAILESVRVMRSAVGKNTHLGTILLLAPLAAVPVDHSCREGIPGVLATLQPNAASLVYEAIRLAEPGGLGKVEDQDLSREPTVTLLEAMALAADRDLVARQYVNQFADVLDFGLPRFLNAVGTSSDWEQAVIRLQLELMATYPDSLILRKGGEATAKESQRRAAAVLNAVGREPHLFASELASFDDWLRAERHQRNPGTTADLIIAVLFVAIRDGHWTPPSDLIHSLPPQS